MHTLMACRAQIAPRCTFCVSVEHKLESCCKLRENEGVQCGFCSVEGHFMELCWKFKEKVASVTGGQGSARRWNGLCHHRRKPGHFKRECPPFRY